MCESWHNPNRIKMYICLSWLTISWFISIVKSHEVQQKEQDFSSLYSAAFIAVNMQILDFEVVINIRLPLAFRMKLPTGNLGRIVSLSCRLLQSSNEQKVQLRLMGISSVLHLFGYKPNFLTNRNFYTWRWRYMKHPRIIRGSSVYPRECSHGWNVPFLESQQNYLQFQNIKTAPVLAPPCKLLCHLAICWRFSGRGMCSTLPSYSYSGCMT